jgi:hypothetical protein
MRGNSTSSRALLEKRNPVPTIKTIACSRGRNKKMARELTSIEDISAAKKKVSTRRNGSSTRERGTAKEGPYVPSNY